MDEEVIPKSMEEGTGQVSTALPHLGCCRIPRVLLRAQEHACRGRGPPLGTGPEAAHPGSLQQLQPHPTSVSILFLKGTIVPSLPSDWPNA